MDTTPLLVAAALPAQVQDLYAAYLSLQTGAATLAAQPQFDLALLPTLAEDQA